MEMSAGRRFHVGESSQAGEARRGAMVLAREAGFDDVEAGRVGIVVSEASSNLVKHGRGGQLLVQLLDGGEQRGIAAIALDQGPGMANLADMMRDGFSTTGSQGAGLGAMARQSSQFDVYSVPGKGTAVFAGIWPRGGSPVVGGAIIGGVCVPVLGEKECGDSWATERRNGTTHVLIADGLGHGPIAREASFAATTAFRANASRPLPDIVARLHEALRPTRGAAIAIAQLIPSQEIVRYCGVGNIVGRIFAEEGERHLVSHFGTLGHDLSRVQEFEYPWPREATLVLHSDGLGSHWTLADYPGLSRRDPTLVAGVLFRDHARARDDCTVVVVRHS